MKLFRATLPREHERGGMSLTPVKIYLEQNFQTTITRQKKLPSNQ